MYLLKININISYNFHYEHLKKLKKNVSGLPLIECIVFQNPEEILAVLEQMSL